MFIISKIISAIAAFITSLTVFFFMGLHSNDLMSKNKISEYLIENKNELETALNDFALSEHEGEIYVSNLNIPECKGIHGVKFYTGINNAKQFKVFEFDCGGKGMGSETSYGGFYYVVSDYTLDPNEIILNAGRGYSFLGYSSIKFVKEDNGWIWRQEDGDNIVYIEHITGNFYYWLEEF